MKSTTVPSLGTPTASALSGFMKLWIFHSRCSAAMFPRACSQKLRTGKSGRWVTSSGSMAMVAALGRISPIFPGMNQRTPSRFSKWMTAYRVPR